MYTAALALLVLAALGPVWSLVGALAARLKLPKITGYIIAGIASGPAVMGALSAETLAALGPVDKLCLSLIALAAGAELQLAELRKIKRQVRRLGPAAAQAQQHALPRSRRAKHILHFTSGPPELPLQVTWITLGIAACTWVLVFPAALALAPYIPFMAAAPRHTVTAIASLIATLAVARSPASAVSKLGRWC